MKVKARIDPERLRGCFRGGMGAIEALCWLNDASGALGPKGQPKAIEAKLKRAADEIRRTGRELPATRSAAGKVAAEIDRARNLVKPSYGRDAGDHADVRKKIAAAREKILDVFSTAMTQCGYERPEGGAAAIVQVLYPKPGKKKD